MRSLLSALFLFSCLPVLAGSAPPLRQSFDLRVTSAPVPVRVEDTTLLAYELHLTNFAPFELELTRLDVLDAAAPATPLASWRDEALAGRIAIAGAARAGPAPRVIAPGQHALVYVETRLDARAAVPRTLRHRIAFEPPGSGAREPALVQGADVDVVASPLPALGPPLRGGPWIALYDAAMPRGHRRVTFAIDGQVRIPARFAIDWMKLDRDGRPARGDDARVANWYGYGEDVLAVADARVVATRNDVPESATLADASNRLEDVSGNFVTLDLGDGRYATYEHLQPGSVRVRAGERVRRGQAIAALGYTGDSSGPHLHFHVSSGGAPLAGEGQPYVIAQFDALGAYASIAEFAAGKPWTPAGRRTRRMELPAASMVVDFGARGHPRSDSP